MNLEIWGREAQERLKSSRVLIAGAGGLGSAAALYLQAGGVGTIRLVDNSRISLANLSYQILYREQDLGKAKATVGERRLKEINSFTLVESLVKAISRHNVSRLASGCQLILDATNNSDTSLLLKQTAAKLKIPLVQAGVGEMDGRLTTFLPGRGPCPACSGQKASLAGESSLLGPLPGILGTLLALEALRILGGLGPALVGRLLCFHGAGLHFSERSLKSDPKCPACQGRD